MTILKSFKFNGVSSDSVGLYMDIPQRVLKPALRTHEYTVPGLSGTVDFGGDTFDKTTITIPIYFRGADVGEIRREIAAFFAGTGELTLDGVTYSGAKVVQAASLEELVGVGKADVTFECQPFAKTNDRTKTEAISVNSTTEDIVTVSTGGTIETPCIIQLQFSTACNSLNIELMKID